MTGPPVTAAAFRERFPMLQDVVHLASCSLGARSVAVDDALQRMLAAMAERGAPWQQFEAEADAARRGFAALIGAREDQIALVPNASVGAYQAVSTLDLGRRRRLVTTVEEFPSLAHVWLAQEARGAHVVYVDGGRDETAETPAAEAGTGPGVEEQVEDHVEDHVERYRTAIDERAALVSVPMVTYRYGVRLPVAEIAAIAHAAGASVLVDAYQAVGVLPVDVDALGCDYLVAGTAKYLLGLPGVAFLYARSMPAGDHDPVLTGWFGRVEPHAFDPRRLDFPPAARRFETGTPPVPALYAANAGLRLIRELELDLVRHHVGSLLELAEQRLADQGERLRVAVQTHARGAHLGLVDADPPALATWLAGRGVAVSPRGLVVRLSFHYYNSAQDVEALCAALKEYRAIHQ